MKTKSTAIVLALVSAVWASQAFGWASANRYGGSTSHSYGSTTHDNRWGGSTSHEAGEGTEHSNVYGGSTRACIRRRDRAHEHVRRQHVRQIRQWCVSHLSLGRDGLSPSGLSGLSDLSRVPPARRGSVLLLGLLRLRGGGGCGGRRSHGSCCGVGEYGGRCFECLRGRSSDRQREYRGGDGGRVQRGRRNGRSDGERTARFGYVRHGDELRASFPPAR